MTDGVGHRRRTRPLLLLIAAGLLTGAAAQAQGNGKPQLLCPGSAKMMAADPLLRDAVKAAYPKIPESRRSVRQHGAAPCLFPYQAILYGDSVVLLTLGRIPGEACHGCAGELSAVFLRKSKDDLTVEGRHDGFAESGTFGDPGIVTPTRLGPDNGIVIEGGGTFQGETSSSLQAFIFRDRRAVRLGPRDGIPLRLSNCEAKEKGEPCTDINAAWRVDPGGRLLIDYGGKFADGTKVATTVIYERRGDKLVLASGKPPAF
ncbi:hypothetical protein [Microvirga lenta]|uniref:hypothetical protein n=1 Tax=Microvirga lenta TaxID=2881337 RepID=UPI001CFFBA8A|nr:hypothetical protein [Microvirga lenta]MCB5175366.1 hypothetical protein [Microvirga lenta]